MPKTAPVVLLTLLLGALVAAPKVRGPAPMYDRGVRQIERILRDVVVGTKGKKSASINIVFRADAPAEPVCRVRGNTATLTLRAEPYWCENPAALAAVTTMLLRDLAKEPGDVVALPEFLLAGLRGKLRHASGAGRINRADFRTPLLRALTELGIGAELTAWQLEAGSEIFLSAMQEEYAAALLDFLGRKKQLVAAKLISSSPAASSARVAEFLAIPENRKLWLREVSRRAWHAFHPRDPRLSRQLWREKWLPRLAPEAREIEPAKNLQSDLREFARGEAPEMRRRIEALARAVAAKDEAALQLALTQLDEAWQRREREEQQLDELMLKSVGVFAVAPHRINLYFAAPQVSPLTEKEQAFLDAAD